MKLKWLRFWAWLTRRCLCAVYPEERADFVERHHWDHCCQGPGCNECWRVEMGIHEPPSPWPWRPLPRSETHAAPGSRVDPG